MRIDIAHHLDPELERRLFSLLMQHMEKIMATLDDLVTKVSNIGTVEDSVIALLNDISARLKVRWSGSGKA